MGPFSPGCLRETRCGSILSWLSEGDSDSVNDQLIDPCFQLYIRDSRGCEY